LSDIVSVVLRGVAVLLVLIPVEMSAQDAPAGDRGVDVVRPGDGIFLRAWNEPMMTDTFRISAAGDVVLPYLGEVHVAGMQPDQLRDSLRAAYAEYRRNASIEVAVLRRISVLGEVTRPGLYLVDRTLTMRDLIANAGGITQQGDARRIYLIRDGQELLVRDQGVGLAGVELQSGDQLVVARRPWLELNLLGVASTAAVLVSVLIPLIQRVF
jgi:protein involved in polysaccharide export with SLBB domain